MELKTLKDMVGIEDDCDIGKDVEDSLFSGKLLKADAMKDSDYIQDAVDFEYDLPFLNRPNFQEADAIISYIKWKHNITWDDLKEVKNGLR